jgi:hypothetical protein
MFYFHFYLGDVCIGEGYGLNPDHAVKLFCQRNEQGPEYADSLTPVCDRSRSEYDDIPEDWCTIEN